MHLGSAEAGRPDVRNVSEDAWRRVVLVAGCVAGLCTAVVWSSRDVVRDPVLAAILLTLLSLSAGVVFYGTVRAWRRARPQR